MSAAAGQRMVLTHAVVAIAIRTPSPARIPSYLPLP
ncbi:hypothetical protein QFZ62_000341 [Clavibacter sp. B3I6]|nr:hypothetical protein [Clavibacter sp. B3I6]